jgi:RHS repeat-associated protein
VGSVARTYDGVGNTTHIGGAAKQFNYAEDDRMSSVQQGGVIVRGYSYNALGERVLSTIPGITGNPDGSGGTPAVNTYTVYDESGRWLGDYDTTGKALQQAIWLDDLPVGLLAGSGANQKLHYIEPDHLGTPRAVIDRTRDVAIWTWALQGEAFGNSPPNQDPDLDSTDFVFDMRFPGQRYDAATGLNYNYFRDYDAGSGRYVQSDPIGLDGCISTYSYTQASPLAFRDMWGLKVTLNLNRPGTWDHHNAARYQGPPNEISISGHGDSRGIWDDRKWSGKGGRNPKNSLNARELAEMIRDLEEYTPSSKIALLSCYAAEGKNSLAEQLHDILKNPVRASSFRVEALRGYFQPFLDINQNRARDPGEPNKPWMIIK